MRNVTLTLLLCSFVLAWTAPPVSANSAPVVSNVTAGQRQDHSKLVDIYYDLTDADGDACTVWAMVSDDGGITWRVPAMSFTGHWGAGITPGSGRHIVWDAGSDMPGRTGSNFRVRVLADDGRGPAPMVLVPGGYFKYQNTTPMIYVNSFLIDKYETTNAFYCQFLNAGGNDDHYDTSMAAADIDRTGAPGNYYYTVKPGRDNYPIRCVSKTDAEHFAAWRSSLEGVTYRLPTEQQWEMAAAWDPATQTYYTYGYHSNSIDSTWCNYDNYYGGPRPVGYFNGTSPRKDAKSYYGCYDMSGNVWEWMRDLSSGYGVLRGGSWYNHATSCTCTFRSSNTPSNRNDINGFRLVLDSP